MSLLRLLTPVANVACLTMADTVRDAHDLLARHGHHAAPLIDGRGRYVGTVTLADLRGQAQTMPVDRVERHAHNPPVNVDEGLAALAMRAGGCGFVPVVDRAAKLIGVIDRRRLSDLHFPTAA